jgi:hypothetical protein
MKLNIRSKLANISHRIVFQCPLTDSWVKCIGEVGHFQATMADGNSAELPNSYVPGGSAQAEFERRN